MHLSSHASAVYTLLITASAKQLSAPNTRPRHSDTFAPLFQRRPKLHSICRSTVYFLQVIGRKLEVAQQIFPSLASFFPSKCERLT